MHTNADTKCSRHQMILLTAFALILLSAVCVGSAAAWSADTSWGQDYDSSVFYINDAGDLAQFASMVNSGKDFSKRTVYLTASIDLNNQVWTPIGTSSTNSFKGTFDGQGYYIDNLYLSSGSNLILGLFGYVDSGKIMNLHVARSKFNPTSNSDTYQIGSIAGVLKDGVISDCSVLISIDVITGNNAGKKFDIGGLVGQIIVTGKNSDYIKENIIQYLQGNCFVTTITTNYNKEWGLLVGEPLIGALSSGNGSSGGTGDIRSAIYKVNYYTQKTDGTYSSPVSKTYVGVSGLEAGVEPASADYVIGKITSSHSDTLVKADGSLVLSVYYDILISYKIEIPDTLVISSNTKTGALTLTPTKLWIFDTGTVEISVDSKYDFHLAYKDDDTVKFPYALKSGGVVVGQGGRVAGFTLEKPDAVTLTAELTGHPPFVGSYGDILTFTFEYVDSKDKI